MFSFCVLELSRCLFLDLCAFLTWYSGYNVGLGTCSCCHRSSTTYFPDLLFSLLETSTTSNYPPSPHQGGTEQLNRKILRLHNCVERGVGVCEIRKRWQEHHRIGAVCQSFQRGGYYPFCLFARETKEFISQDHRLKQTEFTTHSERNCSTWGCNSSWEEWRISN